MKPEPSKVIVIESPTFTETPDSPPPASCAELPLRPVVIPTERADGRDIKIEKKMPSEVKQHKHPEPSFSRNNDRDRFLTSKNSDDQNSRRTRWDTSVKHERHDSAYNRDDDHKHSRPLPSTSKDRSDYRRSNDRHNTASPGSRERPDISTVRHSDGHRSKDHYSDANRSSHRNDRYPESKQKSSGSTAPKSVFHRLGEKLPAKQYENINIIVEADKRKSLSLSKAVAPINDDEVREIQQDNKNRFGDIATSSIDLKDLEELTRIRERLSNEIEGWSTRKELNSRNSPATHDQSTSNDSSKAKSSSHSKLKEAKNDSLNSSLFAAANPSVANATKPIEDVIPPLPSISTMVKQAMTEVSTNIKPRSISPTAWIVAQSMPNNEVASEKKPNVVNMVKQAIAEVSSNSNSRPISPTAWLAVNTVITSNKTSPVRKPTSTTDVEMPSQSEIVSPNAHQPEQHGVPDPMQRLALKYNPKPRPQSVRTDTPVPSVFRDPRRISNISPSYGSPTSHTSPLLPLPHSHQPPLLSTPPQQSFNSDYPQRMPSHPNAPFFSNYQQFDQSHNHSNHQWRPIGMPNPVPQTYGEYRKSKMQKEQQQQPRRPPPNSTPTSSTIPSVQHNEAESRTSPSDQRNSEVSSNDRPSQSQFDSIYRVNDYKHTANAVTSINSNIAQNFKIPKKKTAEEKSTKPSEEKSNKPSEAKSIKPSEATAAKQSEAKSPKPSFHSHSDKVKELAPVSRDPRMNRDPKANQTTTTNEVAAVSCTEPDADETCEVTTSQPTAPSKTADTMVEDLLKSQLNKDTLLAMLGKVLDVDKLAQIKRIIDTDTDNAGITAATETTTTTTDVHENQPLPDTVALPTTHTDDESDVTSMAESDHSPARKKPSKRRNELQKLNDDIRDMFISDGVLTATGRRMCTVLGRPNEDIVKTEVPTDGDSDTPKVHESKFGIDKC